jgi:hypothetical protein
VIRGKLIKMYRIYAINDEKSMTKYTSQKVRKSKPN